jgi:hypothetical protein
MADKGDHPGVHIDPTDFYKDVRQEASSTSNKDKQKETN